MEIMTQKCAVILACAVAVFLLQQPISAGEGAQKLPSYCPPPATVVPLTKVMSSSFVKSFKDCDVVVEATFLKMGNDGAVLGRYNTKKNTTFQVLEPGGAPQSVFGLSFGTFVGIPKVNSESWVST